MRIHVGDSDEFEGEPTYRRIVELLRSRGYAGATVLRGIAGFGANAKLHTDSFLELAVDLPVVIECVDTEEKIEAILPELDAMLDGGLITLGRVQVVSWGPRA